MLEFLGYILPGHRRCRYRADSLRHPRQTTHSWCRCRHLLASVLSRLATNHMGKVFHS